MRDVHLISCQGQEELRQAVCLHHCDELLQLAPIPARRACKVCTQHHRVSSTGQVAAGAASSKLVERTWQDAVLFQVLNILRGRPGGVAASEAVKFSL